MGLLAQHAYGKSQKIEIGLSNIVYQVLFLALEQKSQNVWKNT